MSKEVEFYLFQGNKTASFDGNDCKSSSQVKAMVLYIGLFFFINIVCGLGLLSWYHMAQEMAGCLQVMQQ